MQLSFAYICIPTVIYHVLSFVLPIRSFILDFSLIISAVLWIPFLYFVAFNDSLLLRMDLTPRKRAQIVTLNKHAKKSVREIGKKLGIPKSTVCRIVKKNNDSDVVSIPRRGRCSRKRKTTAWYDQMIMRNSVKDQRKNSVDIKSDLSAAGVNVCSLTTIRRLKEEELQEGPRKSNF